MNPNRITEGGSPLRALIARIGDPSMNGPDSDAFLAWQRETVDRLKLLCGVDSPNLLRFIRVMQRIMRHRYDDPGNIQWSFAQRLEEAKSILKMIESECGGSEDAVNTSTGFGSVGQWQEKSDDLERQRAQTADADQKLSINKKSEEAKNKRAELSVQPRVAATQTDSTPASAEQDDHSAIDVAIVIPLQEEFDELHNEIADGCQPEKVEGTGAYDYLFSRSGATGIYRCVATFVGDMGETKAGLRTQQIRTKWSPKTVVVLGIAAGISKDVMVGDVVVGTLIDSYLQNSKAVDKGTTSYSFEFSAEAYRPSGDLVNESRHFRYAHQTAFHAWCASAQQRLQGALSEAQVKELTEKGLVRAQPVAETGHIACGPVVAAARAFIKQVKKKDRKYLALEMESGGVLAAVYEVGDPSHSLVIRGISDLGDGRKDELDEVGGGDLRRYAVQNAIQFLWGLMDCDALPKSELVKPQ